MSIPLAQLLELSHDLAQGRKRRCEWETYAEKAVTVAPKDEPEEAEGRGNASEDAVEMKLLRALLREQGLAPRAPDAEHAFLRLVCADTRSAKAQKIEGSGFEWMSVPAAEAPSSAQGPAECLCPSKAGGKASDSDATFAHLLAVSASEDDERPNPFTRRSEVLTRPSELLNTDVARSPAARKHIEDLGEDGPTSMRGGLLAALERLSDLVSYDLYYRDAALSNFKHDLSEEDVQFCAEVAQEAMSEAERHELAQLLAEKSSSEGVADAVYMCSIST
jgi:hypothetical protein